ncbi:MAG TPA: right-handed parallel beta-helix repeat-containing protein [Thermoleophilaceae bacterium]
MGRPSTLRSPEHRRGRLLLALVALLAAIAVAVLLLATRGSGLPLGEAPNYYVDAVHGRDSNSGTSPAKAWRTLARVERIRYRGGEAVRLRGGQRFPGTIHIGPDNLTGTSRAAALTITSYGRGRAIIAAPPGDDGIDARNVAGIRIANIQIAGQSHGCSNVKRGYRTGAAGVRLEAGGIHGTLGQGLTLATADVSGFCNGIVIASRDDGSRIAHIRVSHVSSHDNANAGLWTYDQARAQHSIRDVVVSHMRVYRNERLGGIALFGVDGGTVENSKAFENASQAGGGVGIWAFDARRILFTHNESYRNGSVTLTDDGDGFDFDRGVSSSVMEHNYSHDNAGVGFLLCSCNGSDPAFYRMDRVTMRSNVSRNDGSSGQASLLIGGGEEPMSRATVVSNRVESSTQGAPLVYAYGCRSCRAGRLYTSVDFRDNTFVSHAGKQLLLVDPERGTKLTFEQNRWRATGGPLRLQWGLRQLVTSDPSRANAFTGVSLDTRGRPRRTP